MTRSPECPRCGYDQSGAVAAWERNEPACCPLAGVCTECGLEFAWRDLLNPRFSSELRLFEHARRRKFACFLLTWWKAARPWSFWRWVRMEHPVQGWRLVAFTMFAFLLTHVAMVLLLSPIGLVGDVVASTSTPWGYQWLSLGTAFDRVVYPFGDTSYYDLRLLARLGTITPLQCIALLTCLAVPLTFVLIPSTLRRAKIRHRHLARIWAYILVWLPVSLGVPSAVMLLDMAACSVLGTLGIIKPWWARLIPVSLDGWITLASAIAWLVACWSFATVRYLRIPHGGAVAALLTLLTVLLTTLLVLVIGGHWLFLSL